MVLREDQCGAGVSCQPGRPARTSPAGAGRPIGRRRPGYRLVVGCSSPGGFAPAGTGTSSSLLSQINSLLLYTAVS